MVVMPLAAPALEEWKKSSLEWAPLYPSREWQWVSMNPGRTCFPAASVTSAVAASRRVSW